MGKYIGVDWASKGWLGIVLRDDGDWDADLFPSLLSLWKYHSDADRILINIPIGLPTEETGKRACDIQAKDLLGQRQRSVFYTPIREAVYETNLEAARAVNEAAGFSVQNQVWSIVPRIREVDEFLDLYPGARDRLRETHPEVCFHALKGGALSHGKHTDAGLEERKAILEAEYPRATEIVTAVEQHFTTPEYAPMVSGRDDILDAVVAALTAQRADQNLTTLPEEPPNDDRGLSMEIVYPSPAVQMTLTNVE